jgi:hypothetical protein
MLKRNILKQQRIKASVIVDIVGLIVVMVISIEWIEKK